jgi:gliding motility-associated-like protein
MKKFLLFGILLIVSYSVFGAHIYGGEMTYTYISAGSAPNTKKYRITLKLFRDNNGGGAALPTQVWIGIFDYGTQERYPAGQSHHVVNVTSGPTGVGLNIAPCVTGDISGNYSYAEYSLVIDLPNNAQGYICSYETCCRVDGLANVFHPGGVGGTGSTYVCRIPGTVQLLSGNNSSPQFTTSLDLVCHDRPFTWNFSAFDPDGDSLAYAFTAAYDAEIATSSANVSPAPPSSTPPDYDVVSYINGFTPTRPLGNLANINSNTGLISGIAPGMGKYVVCVIVYEYRQGVLIGEHRKDFILRVQDCQTTAAELNPEYVSCDGFTWTFSNEAPPSTNITSWFWDFGDGDTSIQANPTHQYLDTGVYTVTLIINRGQACSDTAVTKMKVFPGFFPDFDFTGICATKPTQFRDRTATNYGVVNTWRWDFGDAGTNADTSRLQNPTYTYPAPGTYNVQFVVTNSKGCIDTLPRQITILDKPPIDVRFDDTLICRGDQVQLEAIGTGTFSWTPTGTIVSGANTATPVVNPVTTTSYIVQLDQNGCLNQDTVKVNVVNFVTLQATPDTTICLSDSIQLNIISDGLRYAWTPAASLNDPTLKNPMALPPAGTTNYQVTATIGSCTETADINVTTVPYPVANAGTNAEICFNTSTQLNATIVGSSFTWTPTTGLSNPNILNPIASPPRTTTYILTVRDVLGCPKPSRDTVVVTVRPKMQVSAGRDTVVVVGQTLQFNATGGTKYLWTPSTGLNNPTIANPRGTYDGSFEYLTYKVYIEDDFPCRDSATVTVRVFKTNPQIFVPSAFTPNRDGKNDRFTFVPVGITKVDYFRVYNRWGQLVYSATSSFPGWDGKIGGKEQGSGVFVWIVQGSDFTGKTVKAKGTVTLIR